MISILMRGKRGWLRILEAFLAIIIFASFLLVIFASSVPAPSKSEEITQMEKVILKEVANNYELREAVFKNDTNILKNFVNKSLPDFFDFEIRICGINQICGLKSYRENVYSEEVIISSTLNEYEPKKPVLFVWVIE